MTDNRLLLVDDDPNILASLGRHLHNKKELQVLTAGSGDEGLEIIKKEEPFSVIVSDYKMPGLTGTEFLARAHQISPDTVRIILTGQAEIEVALDAVNRGKIFRFLMKPVSPETFVGAIDDAMEQYRLITSEKDLLDKTLKGSVKILFEILSMISPITFNKSTRLRPIAIGVATALKYENLWEVELSALLCQIGVATLPREIVEKKSTNTLLSEREQAIFDSHPRVGKTLVENIPRLEKVAENISFQMKPFENKNAPGGEVKIANIPFVGRLLKAIIDYDDLMQTGTDKQRAIQTMFRRWGEYDPEIMKALESYVVGERKKLVEKTIPIEEAVAGSVLARDVLDSQGRVLYSKNTEITEVLLVQLKNFVQYRVISKTIAILEKNPDASEQPSI